MKRKITAVKISPTKIQGLKLILVLFLCFFITNAFAQDYYVSTSGSNSNDGKSPSSAFQTIQKAADEVEAGGTVFIMNGTYNRTTWGSVLEYTKAGTPNGYITFKPYPGHTPKISASEGSWNAVRINGSYVIIEGLEFEGNNANLTLAGATKAFEDTRDGIRGPQGRYNTNCMSIGNAHHVIIRNCKVHDFPAGGIGVGPADYVTIENNIVYNNSWYTMYATSGISIFGPKAIDAVTTYKMIVRGNICYNNKTQVPWYRSGATSFSISDGNGIILDANNGTQNKSVYTGRTLVENNICYNNGGGGVHAFQAARIDIINNTAYNNGTVLGYPEIDASDGTDCRIYNNIMYARNGGDINSNWSNVNVIYDYNLYYNGTPEVRGPNDKIGNPEFVKPALDATADFSLKRTSPAIDAGSNTTGYFSTKDKLGITRPQGARPDMGAYESVEAVSGTGTGLTGRYYNNIDFTGTVIERVDATINFTWASGASPAPGIAGSTYSVIWDGYIKPQYSGTYTFYTTADDGVRLWVNGQQVINNFVDHAPTENSGTISLTAGQSYIIQMQYYNNSGGAVAKLSWSHAQLTKQVISQQSLYPSGEGFGLWATYYNNMDFTGTQVARVEPIVNFSWGSGSPATAIDPDSYAARWTGQVKAKYTQTYTFYTNSDDGVRLWVNGTQLVNNWTNHGPTENSGTISLIAGQKYNIVMEYYENTGGAIAQLSWSSASQAKQIIPQTSLYPAPGASLRMVTTESVVEEETISQDISMYPNPAKDLVHVTFIAEREGTASVEVMTTMLQSLRNKSYNTVQGSNTVTLDVKGLDAGLYLIKVNQGSKKVTKRILIAN